ncbi:MAG: uracil-DNA glycosylase family protein [bacterium]
MKVCNKCAEYGLKFKREYNPDEFLEGKPNSLIWIIGLNPKKDKRFKLPSSLCDCIDYFEGKVHPYFKDFKEVFPPLYDLFGKRHGLAHTDLVKCPSKEFPPKNISQKDGEKIIENCGAYLKKQISRSRPKILICNGSSVCNYIIKTFPPVSRKDEHPTSYIKTIGGNETAIVLAGFIGRIDNYAKRRLGKEISSYMKKFQIVN